MNHEIKDFQKDVIEKSNQVPVLVDFWAEWCAPCRILGPVLEKLANENENKWVLAKVDTDKNQEIAVKYGIRGIPNVKLFFNGEVINEFTGALPEQSIKEWLKKALPGRFEDKLKTAKELFSEKKFSRATDILQQILKGEPDNEEARLLIAKITLFDNPDNALTLIENVDGSAENYEQADSIRTLISLLKKYNKKDEFPPAAVKDEYFEAINKLRLKDFDSALEKFINVIREDKSYDDEGARKACIAIFKYLGEENEITLKHRRNFGSALYI